MSLKIVRRYDAEGNVIEDKDLPYLQLDSPVVRQILYRVNQEMGMKENIDLNQPKPEKRKISNDLCH